VSETSRLERFLAIFILLVGSALLIGLVYKLGYGAVVLVVVVLAMRNAWRKLRGPAASGRVTPDANAADI
jgi:hypothetical protein